MTRLALFLSLCLLSLSPLLFGHYTWIGWRAGTWKTGTTVELQVGHGHQPPVSEEAASSRGLEAAAIAPSGHKTPLQFFKGARSLVAKLPVTESGLWTIYLSQDFGSRTRGVSGSNGSGNAEDSEVVRSYRSAIAYMGGRNWPGNSVGLPFELSGTRTGSSIDLLLRKNGRPIQGVDIMVFHGNSKLSAGATGPDGRLTWQIPADSSGQVVFAVEWVEHPGSHSGYDKGFWSTSLTVGL